MFGSAKFINFGKREEVLKRTELCEETILPISLRAGLSNSKAPPGKKLAVVIFFPCAVWVDHYIHASIVNNLAEAFEKCNREHKQIVDPVKSCDDPDIDPNMHAGFRCGWDHPEDGNCFFVYKSIDPSFTTYNWAFMFDEKRDVVDRELIKCVFLEPFELKDFDKTIKTFRNLCGIGEEYLNYGINHIWIRSTETSIRSIWIQPSPLHLCRENYS
jgi:hypothetical protein